jgi:hypothetical protein
MLTGTTYYLLEQCLQELHTSLWSNFTDNAYITSFWTTAHRYCILPFRAPLPVPGTAYAFWGKNSDIQHIFFWAIAQRYCIIPHKVKLKDSAYYLLEQFFQIP